MSYLNNFQAISSASWSCENLFADFKIFLLFTKKETENKRIEKTIAQESENNI